MSSRNCKASGEFEAAITSPPVYTTSIRPMAPTFLEPMGPSLGSTEVPLGSVFLQVRMKKL